MSCHRIVATSSGRKTADAAIVAQSCILLGVVLEADGTNAASVVLHDNASAASGTIVGQAYVEASSSKHISGDIPECGVVCNNGIYANVTGTGAAFIVYYALSA